jgi:hypothetical protein
VLNIESSVIEIYRFETVYLNIFNDDVYEIVSASDFFDQEIKDPDNTARTATKDIGSAPFCSVQNGKTPVIKYTDIEALNKFNLYKADNNQFLLSDSLYLKPVIAAYIPSLTFNNIDLGPNYDVSISCTENNRFYLNIGNKIHLPKIPHQTSEFLLFINTGFKSIEKNQANINLNDYNIIITPHMHTFMCNDSNLKSYDEYINFRIFEFPNRLKLKVEGPISAAAGDIIEYTVTLMDNSLSENISNAPEILEVYPLVDAGICSHRKLRLKNGVGKFTVDTKNLYAGETIDVKIGWKYITTDSKVTVTLS